MSEECYKKRRDSVFWSPRMLLVCLLSFLFSGTVNAQDKTRVSGNIMDENLQPVIGATITVEGTTLGTSSDARGSFSLEVPASGKLQFSFIGYQTQTVPIERNKTYNIQLLPDATNIDDVVVVGFGTQKKESVIGAIASVQATALSVSSKSALSQTLAGNIPGIIAVQRSGEVGNDRADFWIRGMATFKGNTSPLILVDGVERDFNSIDPKEIESFSILKDASATAVYGVRGANGVIAITTKKGSIGELKVDVSAEYAVKAPTIMPEFVGAVEYMELMNMAHVLGGNAGPEPYPDYRITNTRNRTDPDLYPDVDWMGRAGQVHDQARARQCQYFGRFAEDPLFRLHLVPHRGRYLYDGQQPSVELEHPAQPGQFPRQLRHRPDEDDRIQLQCGIAADDRERTAYERR